jgi:hypothetical protein
MNEFTAVSAEELTQVDGGFTALETIGLCALTAASEAAAFTILKNSDNVAKAAAAPFVPK